MSAPKNKLILGQEPAAIIAAIEAILAIIVSLNMFGLSVESAGVIMTVVVGVGAVITSWATENTRLSAVVGLLKTVLVAGVYFGALQLTDSQITAVVTGLAVVAGLFIRQNNSATDTVISLPSPGASTVQTLTGVVHPNPHNL